MRTIMQVGLLGRKVGMTQIYEADGTAVPVTVLECGPCTVLQVRTAERDGYHAVQLGFDDKKRKSATQAERGHAGKVAAEPKRMFARSARKSPAEGVAEGQTLTVEVFKRDQERSTSSAPARGGASRASSSGTASRGSGPPTASSGCTATPARPAQCRPGPHPQGDQEAGQLGNARITVKNLKVVRVNPTNNLLLIKGAVPGPNGGYLTIRQTNKV